jgi:hypothetical protein
LLIPELSYAGFLNIQLSANCEATTITTSFGSATCGPVAAEGGSAHAEADFGDTGAGIVGFALGTFDPFKRFSATASIQAAYQITFFGAEGPGYMEATLCGGHDRLGSLSAFLITPNSSLSWQGRPASSPGYDCTPPTGIPIVFGVPLDVQLSLQATSGSASCCGLGGEEGADAWLRYQVLDATEKPVSWTASVVVLEPSTWQLWTVGACLLLLVGGARARESRVRR